MKTKWEENTWPQIEAYLKKNKTVLWPVGSTEQHGPTGIVGIDYLTSQAIALEAGRRTGTIVAPPMPFGMAEHHAAFPGTISLEPIAYVEVIAALLKNFIRHGFERVLVVNGHGGNIAPITTAFCQVKTREERIDLKAAHWWLLPEVVEYEQKNFGEENGFHATCGEVSVTQFLLPDAHRDITAKVKFKREPRKDTWPMSPKQFRENYPDGRMASNPALASPEHGKKLFEIAVAAVVAKLGGASVAARAGAIRPLKLKKPHGNSPSKSPRL